MKDSEKFDFTGEPTTEVELSAQDLLELSPSRAIEHSEHCAESPALEQHAREVVTAIAQPMQTRDAPSSANRRMSASRVVLALGFAVAAVTVIGAQYKYSTPERPIQSSLRISPQEAAPFEKLTGGERLKRAGEITNLTICCVKLNVNFRYLVRAEFVIAPECDLKQERLNVFERIAFENPRAAQTNQSSKDSRSSFQSIHPHRAIWC